MNLKSTILLIVIVVVGGLMFYIAFTYQGNQGNDAENINSNNNSNTATQASESFSMSDTSDGANFVYTNWDNDYKITFPQGWELSDDSDGVRAAFFDSVALEQVEVTELLMGMKMEIYAEAIQEDITLESTYQELTEITEEGILEKTDVFVNSLPAFKVKMDVLGFSIATYVIKGNRMYTIAGYVGSSDDVAKYTAQYSSILDSMIFLD